ncbi:hypothetical protein B0H14DRAFT_2697714 [Mycena olivaceomarginata]|nr:hypothetical protein B0H14DRAFT_2697714 [Mycena olivaceomarginata]
MHARCVLWNLRLADHTVFFRSLTTMCNTFTAVSKEDQGVWRAPCMNQLAVQPRSEPARFNSMNVKNISCGNGERESSARRTHLAGLSATIFRTHSADTRNVYSAHLDGHQRNHGVPPVSSNLLEWDGKRSGASLVLIRGRQWKGEFEVRESGRV